MFEYCDSASFMYVVSFSADSQSSHDPLALINRENMSISTPLIRFAPSVAISRIKERARRASCFDRKEITPGQKKARGDMMYTASFALCCSCLLRWISTRHIEICCMEI